MKPMALVGGAFEGASKRTNDLVNWSPSVMPADHDILENKERADARARDLYRNDAYVAAGATLHKDSIVGAAYLLNARPAVALLQRQDSRFDEAWATEFQQEVEETFTLAAESPRCHLDAKGTKTLTDMVRLAVGLDVLCGEVLATVEWLRAADRPFRTAIQMVEIARLTNPQDRPDTRYLRGGVDRDENGKPQGYYIRIAHPYDTLAFYNQPAQSWTYVPARKPWGRPQVIHLFEEHEANQSRGVNLLMSAMRESRMLKAFRTVQLQNAIVQATFAATIESELPTNVIYEMLGAKPGASTADAIAQYTAAYLGALEAYADGARNMRIDGAKIPHLLPGSKLNMQPAGANGQGIGEEFDRSLVRYLATDLGVSYEELSKDFSETNYSSARASMMIGHRHMQTRKKRVADRFAGTVYECWLEEAMNAGTIASLPRGARDLYYEGINREAFSQADWIGASRGQIDEMKETQAAVLRLKYGLSTYEDECARLGKDWRKMIVQRERENTALEQHGLYRPDQDMAEVPEGSAPEGAADDA